uniref:Zgc:85777 n=1 Tax=Hucho hucho TaxID=62062 RepID=A0A4W5N7R6_9TELE
MTLRLNLAGGRHFYKLTLVSSTRKLIGNVSSKSKAASGSQTTAGHLLYTLQHFALKIIDQEINSYVDQWGVCMLCVLGELFLYEGVCVCCAEYGGLGLDFSYSIAVSDELCNIRCGGIPMAIGVKTDMATPALARFGSEELNKEFLLPSIMGDKVSCLGVSEVGSGSDVYVVNGGKMSLICLPMNSPGRGSHRRKIDKMGMRSSDTAEVFFDDVRVPCKNLIGQEGMGFTYQMMQFQEERLWAVGNTLTTRDIIQDTIQYTRQRKIFKMPVLYHQSVLFRLAELETEIELLRSIAPQVALYIKGNDVTKLASMAKLKAGHLSREVGDSCLQYWGGMGFTSDVLVSRFYRDAMLLSIGGGADEVMLSIICKYMDTLPKAPAKN